MGRLLSFVLAFVLFAATAHAAPSHVFDQRVAAELATKDVEAATWFASANAARDKKDFAEAERLYAAVVARVPSFDHALRRLCTVELYQEKVSDAVTHCQAALTLSRTPENLATTALVLSHRNLGADGAYAQQLATEAVNLAPNDETIHGLQCQMALRLEAVPALVGCSERLRVLAPNLLETWMFSAIAAYVTFDLDAGDKATARAKALGAPPEALDILVKLRAAAKAERPWWSGPLWLLPRFALGWALLLLVVLVAGNAMSTATLRSVHRGAGEAVAHEDRRARSLYRAVVWFAAALFYLSLPLVAVVVVGLAAATVLFFLWVGWIPVKLLFIVGIGALFSLVATIRSAFVRPDRSLPGEHLDLGDHPRLAAALARVAERLETRAPDEVRLTIGTELAVTEVGGRMEQLRGRSRRILLLGVGLLDGLSERAFEALLAHELGHFKNEDTAGGGLALAVRRSIGEMADALIASGVAAWYNPAWWFVVWYGRLFLRISQGASRLQEVLADRWAVHAYGSAAFVEGFEHVLRRSVAFPATTQAVVDRAVSDARPLRNLYAPGDVEVDRARLDTELDEVLRAEPSEFDSHPAPRDRIAAAKALDVLGASESDGAAWDLFEGRAAIEESMTTTLCERFAAQGVTLPAATARAAFAECEAAPAGD